MVDHEVIVLGAGAAGLLCAIEAGKRGRTVLVLEKGQAAGEKIRISGGGRCNFTNVHTSPNNYISENPHFCRSALARFTPQDFIALVDQAGVAWHEKTLGQLFCTPKGGAARVVQMLLDLCAATGNVTVSCNAEVTQVEKTGHGFEVVASGKKYTAANLVVATGGPSIPKMGATGFGYELAKQFGLPVVDPVPALVPLTLTGALLEMASDLAGVSLPVVVTCNKARFEEAMLFTHRGLSGPAILQISSYWSPGATITVDLLPSASIEELIATTRSEFPKRGVRTILEQRLPKRLAATIVKELGLRGPCAQLTTKAVRALDQRVHRWTFKPAGTEGYRTAEVTRGGVSTHSLSSKTMESTDVPGLYFIGEAVDVTGHLGGFNFQWAWASGYAAGNAV